MTFIIRLLYAGIGFLIANFYSLKQLISIPIWTWSILILLFVLLQLFPSFSVRKIRTNKLKNSAYGSELLKIFLISLSVSIVYSILGWFGIFPIGSLLEATRLWLFNSLFVFLLEALIFWNGIIRIYLTSTQLGIKWRVIGALCGMIPIANLVILSKLMRIVDLEVLVENEKICRNEERKSDKICQTKYPLFLVHGVFFRDSNRFNYWGRIPKELEENGATIFYGNHQSASSVEDSAKELDARIREIVAETGCEKVNIIAHSKGGLDCRYAISKLGTNRYVASLTTINTPHRGCEFADHLLYKLPKAQKELAANTYNLALRQIGDPNPDFLAAVGCLTAQSCAELNQTVSDMPDIYYQSVGSKLNTATSGRFPLNFTYQFVKSFDGANDGLVGEDSFHWGENFQMVTADGLRGISHGDMIDLNRENFIGFDVREFYVELVHKLKERGL